KARAVDIPHVTHLTATYHREQHGAHLEIAERTRRGRRSPTAAQGKQLQVPRRDVKDVRRRNSRISACDRGNVDLAEAGPDGVQAEEQPPENASDPGA